MLMVIPEQHYAYTGKVPNTSSSSQAGCYSVNVHNDDDDSWVIVWCSVVVVAAAAVVIVLIVFVLF